MKTSSSSYDKFDLERRGKHGSRAKERAPFEVDKGRIIHSAAFRRLQGKTQVLGAGERDFYRTRLTHSLEVAQLGRGLCTELERVFEPNQDLVETIGLAHDIGHPAFGHSGEAVLNKRMSGKNGGFGANPQNLRIVTFLETKYLDSGLDLTRATLDGLVKYPELYSQKHAKDSGFTYESDRELLAWIKKDVRDPLTIPIEAQLADWADQMAYSVNDIEDVVRAGLLSVVEMRTRAREISDEARNKISKNAKKMGVDADYQPSITSPESIVKLANELRERYAEPRELRQRKANLKEWTSKTLKVLKDDCRIVLRANEEPSVRYRYGLKIGAQAQAWAAVLKSTAYLLVFNDPRVTTLEFKGGQIISILFDKFCDDITLLPLDFQELISAGKFGSKERLVADFIAGMTDRYAYAYYRRLFHPGIGSFYEDV